MAKCNQLTYMPFEGLSISVVIHRHQQLVCSSYS